MARIVLVDDHRGNLEYLERVLRNYELHTFDDPSRALEFARDHAFDLLVADQKMPQMTGLELSAAVNREHSDFLTIIVSAYTETDDLIDAINGNQIYKYIVKPFTPDILLQNVHRALERLELERERRTHQRMLVESARLLETENRSLRGVTESPLDEFLGIDARIAGIKEQIRVYAGSDKPILLTGETGTGKELLACSIHALSRRREKPFVAVNCAAFPDNLLESELFGYKKGAFTGAGSSRPGLLSKAHGGTLFLDEIESFPIHFQAKVLRVLQFGTYYPLGASEEEHVDVRIVSASNIPLEPAVRGGTFRGDLYFRLGVLTITIPPLRERRADILFLAKRLSERHGLQSPEFDEEAKSLLMSYSFPGNVRELENLIWKLALEGDRRGTGRITEMLLAGYLMPDGSGQIEDAVSTPESPIDPAGVLPDGFDLPAYMKAVERDIIERIYVLAEGNVSKTAEALGISRQRLSYKLTQYGIGTDG